MTRLTAVLAACWSSRFAAFCLVVLAVLSSVSARASQEGAMELSAFTSQSSRIPSDYQTNNWKLQVSLVPEKTSFMQGEPVYLSFLIRNNSSEDLQLVVGGDTFNWLDRPERFSVRIVRDDGVQVPLRELPPGRPGGNRLVGPVKISSSGSYRFALFLPDWAEFKEPGNYTITAARTLDIGKFARDMSWRDSANLSHIDVQATADVTVVLLDRAALGDVITARAQAMLGSDEEVATQSAYALSVIDDDRTVEPFSRAVEESDYSVKLVALRALARFGNDVALIALRRAAADLDSNIRHVAAVALGRNPHPKALEALLQLRSDANWGVRNTVLQEFAKMQSAESLDWIREMTNDTDARIRTEAQRYLKLRTERQ